MMSIISSSRLSSTPSILKKSNRPRGIPGRSVKFQFNNNLKDVLLNYLNEEKRDDYVEFICSIRDAGIELTQDETLIQIVSEARECISILNESFKLFVQVLLILKWVHRNDDAVQHFKNFILDICSAHNYYTKYALQQLVSVFLEVNENSYHLDSYPTEDEEKGFLHVHDVIKSLLKIIPMSKEVLLTVIKRKFPFRTASARCHLNFVHNILNITVYETTLKREILVLIITKLIQLDTIISKEEIEETEKLPGIMEASNTEDVFYMEVDNIDYSEKDMRSEIARKLDYCLNRVFKYIYTEIHDKNDCLKWEKYKNLYQDIIYIFENLILPTHGSCHTSFIVFYFLSFKRKLAAEFIVYLWNKVTNTNIASVIRQSSVSYISGLLTHSSFVSFGTIKDMIQNISSWLHQYIDFLDEIKDNNFCSPRVHDVFYSSCQALFYLITYKHSNFVNCDKSLKLLENLNLGKIINCHLNPLLVCSRPIVHLFANVMKTYQLAYCFTVLDISDSSLNTPDIYLEEFFPFSYYLLKRSSKCISSIHFQYKDLLQGSELLKINVFKHKKSDNDDDFISPEGSLSSVPNSSVFGCSL